MGKGKKKKGEENHSSSSAITFKTLSILSIFLFHLFTLSFLIYFFKLNKNLTKLEGEISDTHYLILALNNPRALSLVSNGRS